MKRIISVLLVISLFFTFLCSCDTTNILSDNNSNDELSLVGDKENSDKYYRDHQELKAVEVPFDSNNMMRLSIPEVGLENVFIRDISKEEKLSGNDYGRVYLLGDDRYGGGAFASDHYLAIEINGKLFVEDISKMENGFSYFGVIELCDIDGDADSEILLQETVSMTGGLGGYRSRVFDFNDGKITELFLNDSMNEFDTGFSIKILKGNKFTISNKLTGYSETFQDEEGTDEYYKDFWYDKNGEPLKRDIMVDSFYMFSPIDIDADGVSEILCGQYISLIGHANGIGTAKTILKYNKNTCNFEVVDTKFEYRNFDLGVDRFIY